MIFMRSPHQSGGSRASAPCRGLFANKVRIAGFPACVDANIAAVGPAQLLQFPQVDGTFPASDIIREDWWAAVLLSAQLMGGAFTAFVLVAVLPLIK
jgi:hypothetical protein